MYHRTLPFVFLLFSIVLFSTVAPGEGLHQAAAQDGPGQGMDPGRQETVGLIPELEPLRPFLGPWSGRFDDPDETMEILCTWTPILDGQAVKMEVIIEEGGFRNEKTIYYDREVGSLAFLVVTNNGYVARGQMGFDGNLLIETGEQINPEGVARTTTGAWEIMPDGTLENRGVERVEGRWERSPTSHRMILRRR